MKKYTVEQLREMVQEVNGWDGSLEDFMYYEMEQIDELLHGLEVLEILRMAHFGEFIWSDDYFQISAYGNLDSYRELDVAIQLEANQNEIVERYNELVESGEIEELF